MYIQMSRYLSCILACDDLFGSLGIVFRIVLMFRTVEVDNPCTLNSDTGEDKLQIISKMLKTANKAHTLDGNRGCLKLDLSYIHSYRYLGSTSMWKTTLAKH